MAVVVEAEDCLKYDSTSSNTTCAFVPPNPKEFTDALRMPELLFGHGIGSIGNYPPYLASYQTSFLFHTHVDIEKFGVDVPIHRFEVCVWWNDFVFNCQHRFHDSSKSTTTFQVADVGFQRPAVILTQNSRK